MASLSARMTAMTQDTLPQLAGLGHGDSPEDLIDLSGAENGSVYGELRDMLKDAYFKETSSDFLLPTTLGGNHAARDALAAFFNTYFHPASSISREQIVLTTGATSCIEHVLMSVCDEGDSVIIPAPYWFAFQPYMSDRTRVNVITARPGPSPGRHADDLLRALQAAYDSAPDPRRVKALLLCNPQNPLSRCYPEDVLRACLRWCQKREMHLIADELYALADVDPDAAERDGSAFVSALAVRPGPGQEEADDDFDRSRIHVAWSPSKLFGLSGLRIGCLVSQSPAIRDGVSLLSYAAPSSLSATSLTTVLTSSRLPDLLATNRSRLAASYAQLARGLRDLGVEFVPATHGLFVFARVLGGDGVESREDELRRLARLRACGLAVCPGWAFDGGAGATTEELGWARVLFAVPEDVMREAVLRLKKSFSTDV
ncbi:pyridoxal phosphate-dependent transferase [Xylariaceae sp. FL0804]|nr:pyridoxal phosphate-dependent transferase [Xylariaceae sp. FL0804]